MAPLDDPFEFLTFMGFELTEWSEGRSALRLPLRPEFGNRSGLPHGGVYASLLDTAMGYSGTWSAEGTRMAMTLSMTVNFLSRPVGDWIEARGVRTGGGARTYFAEGQITDPRGEVIATASGAFRYRGAPTKEV